MSRIPLTTALSVVVMISVGGCANMHEVGGRTADEVFAPAEAGLVISACEGDGPGVAAAVRSGADPNAQGYKGTTPLLWALSCHSKDGLKALVQAGADPDLVPATGFGAVWAAASYEDPDLLQTLLELGANPFSQNSTNGDTSLQRAALRGFNSGDWTNYETLISAGYDINFRDNYGRSIAFDLIAIGQYKKLFELIDKLGYRHDLAFIRRASLADASTQVVDGVDYKLKVVERIDKIRGQIGVQ